MCDDVSPNDLELFTEGWCHAFAWAVEKVTGWPMYAFDYGGPDLHVFNIMPDGRPFDVEGARLEGVSR